MGIPHCWSRICISERHPPPPGNYSIYVSGVNITTSRHKKKISIVLVLSVWNPPVSSCGSPYKRHWCFSLLARMGCSGSRDAGDLRRHDTCDVPVNYVLSWNVAERIKSCWFRHFQWQLLAISLKQLHPHYCVHTQHGCMWFDFFYSNRVLLTT